MSKLFEYLKDVHGYGDVTTRKPEGDGISAKYVECIGCAKMVSENETTGVVVDAEGTKAPLCNECRAKIGNCEEEVRVHRDY